MQNPNSELMLRMPEKGRSAVKASQQIRKQSLETGKKPIASSFGDVTPWQRKESERIQRVLSLLDMGKHGSPEESLFQHSQKLACFEPSHSLALMSRSQCVEQQLQELVLLQRWLSREANEKEYEEVWELVAAVREPRLVAGEPLLSVVDLGPDVRNRNPVSGQPCFFPFLDVVRVTTIKAASLRHGGSSGVSQTQIVQMFQDAHTLKNDADIDGTPDLHKSWKPTRGFLQGQGRCICCGRGLLHDIARTKLASAIMQLAPKGSACRRWLLTGFIVIGLQGVFFHVGICYLKPKRPTVLRVHVPPDLAWNRRRIEPMFRGSKPDVVLDIELVEELDLTTASNVTLYKLITLDVHSYMEESEWHPSAKLIIEPLDPHLEMEHNPVAWWKGEADEWQAHHRTKKKLKTSRRCPTPRKERSRRDNRAARCET